MSGPINARGADDALTVALATVPSLPRPLLERWVTRAIERLDQLDGDPDLEPAVDDEGERAECEDAGACGGYAIDQRVMVCRDIAFQLD